MYYLAVPRQHGTSMYKLHCKYLFLDCKDYGNVEPMYMYTEMEVTGLTLSPPWFGPTIVFYGKVGPLHRVMGVKGLAREKLVKCFQVYMHTK